MAIQEQTLDLAIIELNRCMRVLKTLREEAQRLDPTQYERGVKSLPRCVKEHAAALRASMDATRILADLRQSR